MNRRLGAALCLAWVGLTLFCIVQITLLETFLTRGIVVLRSQSRLEGPIEQWSTLKYVRAQQ